MYFALSSLVLIPALLSRLAESIPAEHQEPGTLATHIILTPLSPDQQHTLRHAIETTYIGPLSILVTALQQTPFVSTFYAPQSPLSW